MHLTFCTKFRHQISTKYPDVLGNYLGFLAIPGIPAKLRENYVADFTEISATITITICKKIVTNPENLLNHEILCGISEVLNIKLDRLLGIEKC